MLVNDYLAGRRARMLDPLQYFISSVFIQIIVSGVTTAVAPLLNRESAESWLGQLGGMVAIKILFILWAGTLWRTLFRSRRFGLGEIYVFTTYAMATTGVLWSLLPIADLLIPVVLARSEMWVAAITLGIEVIYLTYAVRDSTERPVWQVLLGVEQHPHRRLFHPRVLHRRESRRGICAPVSAARPALTGGRGDCRS